MSQVTQFIPGGGPGAIVETLTGNSGGAVGPTGNNINVVGSGAITVVGNPGTSTLTISDTGGGLPWTVETGAAVAMANNNGYIANRAGLITFTLPAVSPVGSILRLTNINTALGWTVAQGAGQQIFIGNQSTTAGAGGSLSSAALGDTIEMVCTVANNNFQVISMIGNITVV